MTEHFDHLIDHIEAEEQRKKSLRLGLLAFLKKTDKAEKESLERLRKKEQERKNIIEELDRILG